MEQSVIKYFSLIREYIESKNFDAGTEKESKPIAKASRLDLLFKLLDRMYEVLKDDFSLTWDDKRNKTAVRNFITKKLSANFALTKDSMIDLCLALNNGTNKERFFNGCWVVKKNGKDEFAELTKNLSIIWLTTPSNDEEQYPVLAFISNDDPTFRNVNFPDEDVHDKINEKAEKKIDHTLNTDASVYKEFKADVYPVLKFYLNGAPVTREQLEKIYEDSSEKPQAISNSDHIEGAHAEDTQDSEVVPETTVKSEQKAQSRNHPTGELGTVKPLLKISKQKGESNCLTHTVAEVNNYLKKLKAPYRYAEQGDPGLAECVIDFYGRQFKTRGTDNATHIKVNVDRAKAAYDYINACLDRKLPVLVGLNYREDTYKNNDGVTDHFSAIVGRTIDKNNGVHFILADSRDGEPKLLDVKDNYEIHSARGESPAYQVAQVRAYSMKDFRRATGEELTTADELPRKRDWA